MNKMGQSKYCLALPFERATFERARLGRMSRSARILGSDSGGLCYYHVMSRCVDRQMAFDDVARGRFRRILNAQLSFSGVRCINFSPDGQSLPSLAVGADGESVSLSHERRGISLALLPHLREGRRRGGDRESGLSGKGVPEPPGKLWSEPEGRSATDAWSRLG
jgi:hypothetical protein